MAIQTPSTVRTIDIDRDHPLHLDAIRGRIQIAHGCAWLTEAGRLDDTFLVAGEQWPLAGQPVVLGALAPTRVRVVGDARPQARLLARWWRRLAGAARREVQRLQFGPLGGQPWV